MTTTEARTLAQSDPVPNLAARWGEVCEVARQRADALADACREVDKIADQLAERGLHVSVDLYLGPIGNAAAAARRDLEKQRHEPTFELPR